VPYLFPSILTGQPDLVHTNPQKLIDIHANQNHNAHYYAKVHVCARPYNTIRLLSYPSQTPCSTALLILYIVSSLSHQMIQLSLSLILIFWVSFPSKSPSFSFSHSNHTNSPHKNHNTITLPIIIPDSLNIATLFPCDAMRVRRPAEPFSEADMLLNVSFC
jgi:hypothetical protein